MKRSTPGTAAFSLVEITLALGLAAFCLISIFGLLPVGITTNKAAIDQTAANGILSGIIADLRATPRTIPHGQAAASRYYSIPIPANPVLASPGDTTLFFTGEGKMTNTAGQARYRVTVSVLPNGSDVKTATFVRLTASWPAVVSSTSTSEMVALFSAFDRN